jgi:hypothetical protein
MNTTGLIVRICENRLKIECNKNQIPTILDIFGETGHFPDFRGAEIISGHYDQSEHKIVEISLGSSIGVSYDPYPTSITLDVNKKNSSLVRDCILSNKSITSEESVFNTVTKEDDGLYYLISGITIQIWSAAIRDELVSKTNTWITIVHTITLIDNIPPRPELKRQTAEIIQDII